MSGTLFVTGTPIGNLSDLSPRAAKTLEEVDFIAAEDTRVTLKLLNHLGVKKPMVSYYEHNKRERGEIICARIEQGENCAIVTDAGMPCISDPGEDLIKLCAERGIKTVVVPGPSAVIAALAVSGLTTGRFCFEGFLSVNKKSRGEHLQSLLREKRTMISTKQAAENLSDGSVKGEIVLVLEGAPEAGAEREYSLGDAVALAKKLIENGERATDAAKEAAAATGFKKNEIYRELL